MLLTKCCAFNCCLPPRAPLLARSRVPGRSAGRSHLQQHEVGESAQVSQAVGAPVPPAPAALRRKGCATAGSSGCARA